MYKKNLKDYETSYIILIGFIVIQLFLVFINVYNTQVFSIEVFTIIIIELLSVMVSYFIGLVPAAIFSTIYVLGYILYSIVGENPTTLINYILIFFIPISIIYSGNMNKSRKEITNDLYRLNELQNMQLKIDPHTHLENEIAFREVLSKHRNLGYRYPSYYFSVYMFRIEFIETVRRLLDPKEFVSLLEKIAEVIQNGIREEDYKFIVNGNRFVIITPMTSCKNIAPAIRRILEDVGKLDIRNNNGEKVDIVLKAGGLDYLKEENEMFEDHKKVLLGLQRVTDVDVRGEYTD